MTISGIEINYHGIFNYHFSYSMCEYKRNSRCFKEKEYECMPTINKKQSIRNQKHSEIHLNLSAVSLWKKLDNSFSEKKPF